MDNGDNPSARHDKPALAEKPWTVAVNTPAGGPSAGQGLGASGYSYEFVRCAFQPLLERWGEVVELQRPESQLDFAVRRARRRGRRPVSLSFRPLQDVYLSRSAPNVVFPFWEFPDIPASDYKDNPRNHWVRIANRSSLILTASEFTAAALSKAGVRTPIRVVPVPVQPAYFELPAWDANRKTALDCTAYVFTRPEVEPLRPENPEVRPGADSLPFRIKTKLKAWARRFWIAAIKPCLPLRLSKAAVAAKNAFRRAWREGETELPTPKTRVELSGVVYTTFLNPDDKRKNWEDLLSAFLLATKDREDATLVIKLVTSHAPPVREILGHYYKLGIAHRSKLVFITSYLSDAQLHELTRASAYYITATRAEGACLPLQDFLAAGRPAVSPRHTAIADYFDDRMGFVVASHPEPCPWPQDDSGRFSTSWQRIVWSSLAEKIADSYDTAVRKGELYRQMSREARRRLQGWASTAMVWPRLAEALSLAADSDASGTPVHRRPHYPLSRGASTHLHGRETQA
ncbi:MAG TPA: glycosyltransferase [Pirellulales bacterium]|nr:glycosyltransferase [Pirellulales bacterium]